MEINHKVCKKCGRDFTPNSNRQETCLECRDEQKSITDEIDAIFITFLKSARLARAVNFKSFGFELDGITVNVKKE